MHFLSTKPVLNDHLSYVTIFHCSLGRSHKTGLIVYYDSYIYIVYIYTHTYNQCLSPLIMPVLLLPVLSYTQFSFIGQSLSVTNGRQAGQRLSPGSPVSSTINTDLYHIIETS